METRPNDLIAELLSAMVAAKKPNDGFGARFKDLLAAARRAQALSAREEVRAGNVADLNRQLKPFAC